MDNYIGLMVSSLAGRDKGRTAVIVGIIDENYVLISDGRLRKCEAPKKKKLRHLKILTDGAGVPVKLETQKFANKFIREAVRNFETPEG